MQREIDMTPYEEYFTKLEKLFFEKNARMNIITYMLNNTSFTKEQHDQIFQDYVTALNSYEKYILTFEEQVVIPLCGHVRWTANFKDRVINID